MSSVVMGDDSGFPKRCFTWTFREGKILRKFTWCVIWLQWPTFFWRRVTPDPGPESLLKIQGVSPELLKDLEIVDTIAWLAKKLSPKLAKTMDAAVKEGLGAIQKKLPSNLSLSS
jgi:hypothetical protein